MSPGLGVFYPENQSGNGWEAPQKSTVHETGASPVGVVGHEGPGVDPRAGLAGQSAKPPQEPLPVLAVIDDPAPLDPPDNHVMQGPWRIQPGLTGHLPSNATRTWKPYQILST